MATKVTAVEPEAEVRIETELVNDVVTETTGDDVIDVTAEDGTVEEPSTEHFQEKEIVSQTREASESCGFKRRMPENLRRFLLKVQGGKYYLPAAYRIVWFRDECPDWGVSTSLIEGGHEAGFATVQAIVYNPDGRIIASGLKTESRQDFPAGWVEKAETGAIARALAVAGFGTQFTPDLDDDGAHVADSPQIMSGNSHSAVTRDVFPLKSTHAPERSIEEIWAGPGQCPNCHAPEGKRHGKPCRA